MTQEEKQLLLKDLCARLPYGVIADCGWQIRVLDAEDYGFYSKCDNPICKPYLRSMSSMTKKEKEWLYSNFDYIESFGVKCYDKIPEYYDWLNAHHFDYRGLIEKGLVLEAKEGMYKTE